ncbi:MAG: cyclic nucleotide-binding domain-containing protein, partial [Bacteroidetes bacterium]
MENELVAFLSAYITLTPELTEAITASGMIQHFKKKTVLLKEGDRSNECYFILKGCIRSYYIKDGEEKTTDFFTEGQAVSPSCYGTTRPSDQYLECLEDTIASIGTPDLESEMYAKYPQLETLARVVGEHMLSGYKDTFAEFKMSSP